MPRPTAATCVPAERAETPDDWTTVVVRQHGKPPMRFSGLELVGVDDGNLSIRIWQARKGGFVLAHAIGDGTGQTVARHATAGQAMAALEIYCRDFDTADATPAERASAERLDIADLLEEVALRSERRRRFRRLAGAALDLFDAWCVMNPPHEAETRT